MKRFVTSLLTAFALLLPSAYAMHGEEIWIRVTIGGRTLTFEDQQPVIINGRTLVPVRGVMETLGAKVEWRDDIKSVLISKDGKTLTLAIDNDAMKITENGKTSGIKLDAAPVVLNGRTCLPIRAVAEQFGAKVSWDQNTRTVRID